MSNRPGFNKPRQSKTPKQRAEEAVGVLERRLTKLSTKRADMVAEREAIDTEINATEARLAYAKQNPDLSTPTTTEEN